MSIEAGCVPSDWKLVHIVPLFKKGDKSAAANYRQVSLTPICYKVMEHILHSSIMSHLEDHSILIDVQNGFRSRRFCETQLIATVQNLPRNMSDGKQTDVTLLDFAKAFDKVSHHRRLLNKLHHYGIRGPTLSCIAKEKYRGVFERLPQRQETTCLGRGCHITRIWSHLGVPQGKSWVHCLFLVFINELPDSVSSNVKLLADDSALQDYKIYPWLHHTSTGPRISGAVGTLLVDGVPSLKCTTIRITKKRKPFCVDSHFYGHILETVPGVKYLGVYVSQDLSWLDHIYQTANRSVGFRAEIWGTLRHMPRLKHDLL